MFDRYLQVPPPNAQKLSDAEFYTTDQWGNTLPNVEDLKIHFFKEGRLCEHHALWLIEHASTLLKRDANLVHLTGAVTSKFRCSSLKKNLIMLFFFKFVVIFMDNMYVRYRVDLIDSPCADVWGC